MKKIIFFSTLFIFLVMKSTYSRPVWFKGYLNLTSFARQNNFRLSYSIYKDRVILHKRGIRVSLRPGTDIIIINSKALQLKKVIRKVRGNILIPKQLITFIGGNNSSSNYVPNIIRRRLPLETENDEILSRRRRRRNRRNRDRYVVILDAGHGGKDPGCINRRYKIYEKNVVFPVILYTQRYLKKMAPELDIILTRKKDVYLNLRTRANIANSNLGPKVKGVFVSVHANYSVFNSKSYGVETFYYSPNPQRGRKERKILKYRLQNISRVYYGGRLTGNTLKVASRILDFKLGKKSKKFANIIQKSLISSIPGGGFNRGIKRDRFFVLAHTVMPSILIELGFLSHRREALLLKRKSYQKALAKGIARGIYRYMKLITRN